MNKTDFEEARTLEQVCEDSEAGFFQIINNNPYCLLAPSSSRIECFYRGKEIDKNGLYQCLNGKHYENHIKDLEDIERVYVEFNGLGHA